MRIQVLMAVVVSALPVAGTTLQQLSLEDMIRKSTAIVRGTAQPADSAAKGSVIYTHYQIKVTETWKGAPAAQLDVAVPGGMANGLRQTYSGAPALGNGQQYVFFLWTSRSGLTQIIGLSQGLFNVVTGSNGVPTVTRAAASAPMLNTNGASITDSDFSMPLADFKTQVSGALAQGAK